MSKENKNDLLNILRIQEIELQEQDQQLTKLGKTLINAVNLDIERKNRIAELEKENEEKEDKILDLKSYNSELKETISKLSFSAVRCQAINDEVCQYILDNELLKKENEQLKQQLAEKDKLLKNQIVPKFKVGEKIWYISHYNEVISNTIYNIHYYSNKEIAYNIPNLQREEFIINESELFSTEQEAEEALKKLNKE